jgi:hypothetical protein
MCLTIGKYRFQRCDILDPLLHLLLCWITSHRMPYLCSLLEQPPIPEPVARELTDLELRAKAHKVGGAIKGDLCDSPSVREKLPLGLDTNRRLFA